MANQNVWVLVETVSMYRMRYVIECPADHPEYALDTVTSDNAKEFSQNHIGETISSHRVISEEEALKLCLSDNPYTEKWSKDVVIGNHFTIVEE